MRCQGVLALRRGGVGGRGRKKRGGLVGGGVPRLSEPEWDGRRPGSACTASLLGVCQVSSTC